MVQAEGLGGFVVKEERWVEALTSLTKSVAVQLVDGQDPSHEAASHFYQREAPQAPVSGSIPSLVVSAVILARLVDGHRCQGLESRRVQVR